MEAVRTSGVLVAMRPCGVVVALRELLLHESTHETLHFLWKLSQRVRVDVAVYDNACKLCQCARKAGILETIKFVVDRFHQKGHKCTAYNANDCCAMRDVNSQICEQCFRWVSHLWVLPFFQKKSFRQHSTWDFGLRAVA